MSDGFNDETNSGAPQTIDELIERVQSYYPPNISLEPLRKCYEFSSKAHEGQLRRSGEPYIFHPLSVAAILADLKLDLATVMTGILHDTVEDTKVTLEEIEKNFSKEVATLVDGVTKISKISFRHTQEKQSENIRKMIVAMGKDIRVVLVKLADRLHNMRTLNHMPYTKQARIAQETLDIYAPLANRLGISAWKIELEDLSFRYLKPDEYYDLAQKVARKKKEREKYIDDVKRLLVSQIGKSKVPAEIYGRPKHLFSIYRKMQSRSIDYEQVYDVLAFRIIVDNVAQCYEALGIVHSLYKPIPGRFKDFIAMAKPNNYQSLHTTLIGPEAERIEVQIRTKEMHLVAEKGIAAHWKYKERNNPIDSQSESQYNWLRDLVNWHQQSHDPTEFLENVKTDLYDQEVFVFTPTGDVKALPDGATPLDFAYAVHTDVGNHTVSVKVNGRMVPLKSRLENGDTIEVLTSPNQHPSKDWLKFCITTRAQSKIRNYIRMEERKRSIEMGQQLLEREFRRFGINSTRYLNPKAPEFEKMLRAVKAGDLNELYIQVGYGKLTPAKAVELLAPDLKPLAAPVPESETFLEKVFKSAASKNRKSGSAIRVDGMDDLLVRYARCCNPIPGDPIVGYISRGRGVTVHQTSCPKSFEADSERRVEVEWTEQTDVLRSTKIKITGHDKPGLLKLISEAFATHSVNINNAQVRTTKENKAICVFDVTVRDRVQLSLVIQELLKVPGVLQVDRMNFN